MILCFDRWENDMAIGSLWTFFQSTPIPFHGLDNLLFIMDAMKDQAEQPMSWMARRHIKEQARPHSDRRTQIQNLLSFRPGLLSTVSIRIYTRQHATIQGTLRVESNREVAFRSGLELLYLLREITNHPFALRAMGSERV